MSKIDKKLLKDELWRRGELTWKMHSIQKEMFSLYEQAQPRSTQVWLLSRQTGKCISENTLVATTKGSVKIKDIKVGDIVYGYNSEGKVEQTEVKQVHNQGKKKVVDLKHRHRVIATCTLDHRWLAWDEEQNKSTLKTTREILQNNKRFKIKRELIASDYLEVVEGEQYETQTYDIGIDNGTHLYCLANGLVTHNSYGLALIATIEAIRKPNSIIKLLTDTKLHVRTIFEPIFREILQDCPEDVKPEYIKTDFIYQFPNGSQIQMAGTDAGNAERLRGQRSTLILVDEAGFCTNLNYNVLSILLPTTTHTKGKIILASTPPEEPDHEFIGFIEQAEMEGSLTKKTLFDNPILTEEDKKSIIARFPNGVNNPQFKREYLCEIIRSETKTVIPEFTDELEKAIVMEYIKPPHFTPYVSMDVGFKDLTFVLFGYYDFKANKLIIEKEIVKSGKDLHLPNLSKEIYETEQFLWTNYYTNEFIEPEMRVSDIDYIVIQEINRSSKGLIDFSPIKKETGYKLPLINRLRVMLQSEQIIIDPKCVNLIRHLKNARWKDSNTKSEFARSPDDGHYDGVDALLYMVKTVNFNKNPYPKSYGSNSQDHYINNSKGYKKEELSNVYHSIFGRKKSR